MKNYTEEINRQINELVEDETFEMMLEEMIDSDRNTTENKKLTDEVIKKIFNLPTPEPYQFYLKRRILEMDFWKKEYPEELWKQKKFETELWEDELIYTLLARLSRKNGDSEKSKRLKERWQGCLTGTAETERKTLFNFGIVLGMEKEDFIKMLLAYDGTMINSHSVFEMISWYFICNQNKSRYDLEHRKAMLDAYDMADDTNGKMIEKFAISEGYTRYAEGFGERLAERDREEEENDRELLEFLIANKGNLLHKNKKESQYSKSRAAALLQLLRYCYVANGLTQDEEDEDQYSKYEDKRKWYQSILENTRDLFYNQRKSQGQEIVRELYSYFDDITQHVNKIENEIFVAENGKKRASKDAVSRNDVLLFAAIFLNGLMEQNGKVYPIRKEDLPQKKDKFYIPLDEMNLDIDMVIAKIQADDNDDMKDLIFHRERLDLVQRLNLTKRYFDMFLESFSMFELYLPNLFDRCIMISFLTEAPMECLWYLLNKKEGNRKEKTFGWSYDTVIK